MRWHVQNSGCTVPHIESGMNVLVMSGDLRSAYSRNLLFSVFYRAIFADPIHYGTVVSWAPVCNPFFGEKRWFLLLSCVFGTRTRERMHWIAFRSSLGRPMASAFLHFVL